MEICGYVGYRGCMGYISGYSGIYVDMCRSGYRSVYVDIWYIWRYMDIYGVIVEILGDMGRYGIC